MKQKTKTSDFQNLFESVPGLFLVLSPDFKIVAASDAYLKATMMQRNDIMDRGIFDVFPDNPNDTDTKTVANMTASLNKVLQNKTADTMTVRKHGIQRSESEGGGYEERYWSPLNSPVFGVNNEVLYIIHRVEDVTELIQLKMRGARELQKYNHQLEIADEEKGKRAAELNIANKELVFQNDQKEKRAEELVIANKELVFQNDQKEKRAAELSIANRELAFQNKEKGNRAEELVIANKELVFQNDQKEKRAAELGIANKELEAFTYVSSHDLQEPLRKIQTFVSILLENENKNLSDNGKHNFRRIQLAAGRMRQLIEDLLAFSRINTKERKFEKTDLNIIIEEAKTELKDTIQEKHAIIEANEICPANIIAFQFRQLMYNLISNGLKFSRPGIPSHIIIKSNIVKANKFKIENPALPEGMILPEINYCHITVKDNGIGFEPHFSKRIFEVFQKLHSKEEYAGTGIGLAIVKKIVENHNGIIIATSALNKGATFDIYIPAN